MATIKYRTKSGGSVIEETPNYPAVLEKLYRRRIEATAYTSSGEILGQVIRGDWRMDSAGRMFRWTWWCEQ